ncbi:TetR/AcrR family transcriptional regulator [Rhizobium sp. Root651]|uniref:TetR/AcrR family transcriptional regulator n=1 Tax=Rhizobium sp. Root651 TaxID=1736577 RepID=UPI000713ECB9|nr:TetR/AcrR family transcriptional regulator [Rhizobium sp. Root651]KRA65294.1 transcriptional regulator [Rhizobium sp. Root651]
MARINLERRAAIGEAKRARTRAAILEAARACFADPAMPAPTVEAVTQAAGIAKGTFYLHFRDLQALEAELGEALLAELSERLEPARLVVDNPLTRIATAVTILLRDLAAAPTQARLAARAVVTLPDVAEAVQARLRADLTEAQLAGMLAVGSVDLAARIVVALVEQASWLFSAGRIDATAVPDIVRAILRALGCPVDEAAERTDEAASNADAFAKRTSDAASKGPSA